MNKAPNIESANIKNVSQLAENKVISDNDIAKQTFPLAGKPKVKRIFQKIDFKTLQKSGFDRQIAEVIYRKNVNESKAIASSTSLVSSSVERIIIPDSNVQSTNSASEILNSLGTSSGIISTSDLCHDSRERELYAYQNQNMFEKTKVAEDECVPCEHLEQAENDMKKTKLLTKEVAAPILQIHSKPPADECLTSSFNCEKISNVKKDSTDKIALKKSKIDVRKNKNQIVIPKASIKSSRTHGERENTSEKLSKKKFTMNSTKKSNTKDLIVLENKVSPENEMMDLTPITKYHVVGGTTSRKISRRRSSANPIRNSTTKSLIVLENKVLSENEMIDLTSLKLPNTNKVSCSLPLTKPLEEILKKKTKVKDVTTTNARTDTNVDASTDMVTKTHAKTNTKNERTESAIDTVKELQIVETANVLDFPEKRNNASKSRVKAFVCPLSNTSMSDNPIKTAVQSSIKNTNSKDVIDIIPTPIRFEHSKSAVQIINEPKINDTFSAVDFLASLGTTDDVDQISSEAVSLEELNLSALFGQNFVPLGLGQLKCHQASDETKSNLVVELDKIVTTEQKSIASCVDVHKVGSNTIISDDNESESTDLIENVKISSPFPPSSSSPPQELSISPINCISSICKKEIDSAKATSRQNVSKDFSNNENADELKANETSKNGRRMLASESNQAIKECRRSSLNSLMVENKFSSLHNIPGDQKSRSYDNLVVRKLSSNIAAYESHIEKSSEIREIKKSVIGSPTIQNEVEAQIENCTTKKINESEAKVTVNCKNKTQPSTENDGKIQSRVDNKSFKTNDHSIRNYNFKRSIENVSSGRYLKRTKVEGNEKGSKKSRKVLKGKIGKNVPKNVHLNKIDYKSCKESISTKKVKEHKLQPAKLIRQNGSSAITPSFTPNEIEQTIDKVPLNVKQFKEEKELKKFVLPSRESNRKIKRSNKFEEFSEPAKRKKQLEKLEKKTPTFNKIKQKKCGTEDGDETHIPLQTCVDDTYFEELNKNAQYEDQKEKLVNKIDKSVSRTFKKHDDSNDFVKQVEKCMDLKDSLVLYETEIKSEESSNDSAECSIKRKRDDDNLEFLSIKNEMESPSKSSHSVISANVPTDIEVTSIHNLSQSNKSFETSTNQLCLHFENSPANDDDGDCMEFLGFEDNDQSISDISAMNVKNMADNSMDNNKQKDATLKSWLTNIGPNQDKNKDKEPFNSNFNVPLKKRRDLSGNTSLSGNVGNINKETDTRLAPIIKEAKNFSSEIENYDATVKESKTRKKRRKKSELLFAQTEKIKDTLSNNSHNMDTPQPCLNDITLTPKKKGRVRKLEVNFNPRLLLITKREHLDTDVKLTDDFATTADNGASDNKAKIQCGLCLKYINSSNSWISHLSEHYGVGWIVGEPALNLNCRSSVLNHMIAYYKETQIKGLSCRMCQKIYRSALGLLMHIEICGLPPEKVECDYCKRMYAKASLVSHKRICSVALRSSQTADNSNNDAVGDDNGSADGDAVRDGEQRCQSFEQLDKVIGNTGRVKRVSTIKAETKLKKINAQLTNVDIKEDIKGLINYVACDAKSYVDKWQKELNLFGKAFCPQKTCKFYSTELIQLEEHVKLCKYIQQPGYYCKLCKTLCFDTVDLVSQHIQEKHQDKLNPPSDNSDCNVNTADEESTDDGDHDHDDDDTENDIDDVVNDASTEKSQNSSSKKVKKANRTISTSNNNNVTLKGRKGFCIRYFNTENLLLNKWLNFLKSNYSDVPLYTEYVVEYMTKRSVDLNNCLPKQLYSMKFTISENMNFGNNSGKCKGTNSPKLKWLQLKRFETLQNNNDEIFLFCGAPVKALYWIPLPNKINEQYLVVICRKDLHHYARLNEPKQLNSTVLIFKVKQTTDGATKYPQTQLHYGIGIEDGPIHDLSFLPSGGYDESNNRLALMAVANISDIIKIYALPINFNNTERRADANNGVIILELKPVFHLQRILYDMKVKKNEQHQSCKTQCLKICWSETFDHKHIFAGFSNGFLGIWDITDNQEDNLNRFVSDSTIIFVPINYWYVGEDCVKHLQVHYDTNGPRWLAVVGKFRRYIVYDIRDFMQPIIIKCESQSSIICTLDWPLTFETFLLGVCDCIAYNGRCLFAVNPIGANFSHNKLDNMLSGVVNVHYTPITNVYVCGMANGDIIFLHSKKLPMEWPERKNVTLQRVFSTIDVISLLDCEINDGNNADDDDDITTLIGSLSDDFQMFDPLYKEKYGLIFGGKLFKLGASQRQLYLNEKRRPPFCILPYKRISSIRCNLNIQGKDLIAFGYDNGFIRVIHFDKKHYFE